MEGVDFFFEMIVGGFEGSACIGLIDVFSRKYQPETRKYDEEVSHYLVEGHYPRRTLPSLEMMRRSLERCLAALNLEIGSPMVEDLIATLLRMMCCPVPALPTQ